MPIPYPTIHTKVPTKSNILRFERRHSADHTRSVQMERRRDHRRTHDAGSHTPALKYTAEDQYIRVYGVSQR